MCNTPIRINPPTVPATEATVVLFDSTVTFNKAGLQMMGIRRIILRFPGLSQASADEGLIGYESGDKGTTWSESTFASADQLAADANAGLPETVAADTGADHSEFDIDVAGRRDVMLTFTAGVTPPSAASWANVTITLEPERTPAY
jgi:hypothetical protein